MRDVVKLLLRPVSVLSLGLSTMGMMGPMTGPDRLSNTQNEVEGLAGRRTRVRWDAAQWPRLWLAGACADLGPGLRASLGVGVAPAGATAAATVAIGAPSASPTARSADLTARTEHHGVDATEGSSPPREAMPA